MNYDKRQLLSWVKFFIGWPLGILAIAFIVRFLAKDSQVLSKLANINIPILLVSLLCFTIYYFLRVYIWKKMMKVKGYDLPLKKISYAWEFSEIIRFVPGAVWALLSRAKLFEELGVPKGLTAKLMWTEIEMLVTACTILSILSLPTIQAYTGFNQSYLYGLFITGATALTLIVLFGFKFLKGRARHLLPDFGAWENFSFLLLYVISFFLFSTGVYFASASVLGPTAQSFLTLVGFFTFAFLIGYISPFTPGGIGLREAIITFGLSSTFSVPIAGLIAIFSRVVLVVTELLFLLFVYAWKKIKL